MEVSEFIEDAESLGFSFSAESGGKLRVAGQSQALENQSEYIQQHKIEIIEILDRRRKKHSCQSGIDIVPLPPGELIPDVCRGCCRIEILEGGGGAMVGCLYVLDQGPYPFGWTRLPDDISWCMRPEGPSLDLAT